MLYSDDLKLGAGGALEFSLSNTKHVRAYLDSIHTFSYPEMKLFSSRERHLRGFQFMIIGSRDRATF